MTERLSDYLRRLPTKVITVAKENFAEVVVEAHRSIQSGSEITGAPGQPIDTGTLMRSWLFEFPTPFRARIVSTVDYAIHVEDNLRGVTFKNHGPHSVKLTIAGLQRIVETVAARKRGVTP